MSADVVKFPTRTVLTWTGWEKIIRERLKVALAEPDMEKEVCERMREFFKLLYIPLEFHTEVNVQLPTLPEGLAPAIDKSVRDALETALAVTSKEVWKQFHENAIDLLGNRLILEIEFYKLRHGEA